QWPLPKEKLDTLHQLVQEQLQQGHLEPSTSPWKTPVFIIKKKWRLLQDFRKVNAVMEGMGALQPGMPSPTMIPTGWDILIIELKDCFFTIPLHPDDKPKFTFTVPAINNAEPAKRYQWKVLPQGMRNSPIICQWVVATGDELLRIQPQLLTALHAYGLDVAPEKVQQHPPWKYLGVKILDQTIQRQEVRFPDSTKTLNDGQKLLGVINCLQPYLGLTAKQLSPLFNTLKGDPDL
ncbi:hypothetical protein N302_04661, partial [Corvus brachyrhynchos]